MLITILKFILFVIAILDLLSWWARGIEDSIAVGNIFADILIIIIFVFN